MLAVRRRKLSSHHVQSSKNAGKCEKIPKEGQKIDAHLVGGDKVPDEKQDVHDNVLCNRDDVRASNFEDLEALLSSGIEVNVVGSNTGRDTDLEVLGLQIVRS